MGAAYAKTAFPVQNPASTRPSPDRRAPSSGNAPDGEDGVPRPIPADAGGAESPHGRHSQSRGFPCRYCDSRLFSKGGVEASPEASGPGGPSTSPKGRLTADVILPLCCLQTCRGRGDGACSRLAAPGHEQRLGERREECNRKGGRRGKERRRGKRREGTLWPFGDSPRGPHGTRVLHASHTAPHIVRLLPQNHGSHGDVSRAMVEEVPASFLHEQRAHFPRFSFDSSFRYLQTRYRYISGDEM